MNNKKGISLVTLIITIIVMIILSSAVIYMSADSINNAKTTAFASELTQLEDLVSEYYLNNNALPITGEAIANIASKLTDDEAKTALNEELTENGDTDATFYKLDLRNLDIDEIERGTGADETDIYLVSEKSMTVYYLKGIKVSGEYYFSLSEDLTGKKKINNNSTTSSTSNITIDETTSGINLTKSTNDYTNKLTVTINTTLNDGETLKYQFSGQSSATEIASGVNTIDVEDIITGTDTTTTRFYNNGSNLIITKYSGDTLLATSTISLSNFDISSPKSTGLSATYTEYDSFNFAKIVTLSDVGKSKVSEVRVLYTKKLDSDSNIINYYDDLPGTITSQYVNNRGKSVDVNGYAYAAFKLPKDVTEYVIVVVDNAGNMSNPIAFEVSV